MNRFTNSRSWNEYAMVGTARACQLTYRLSSIRGQSMGDGGSNLFADEQSTQELARSKRKRLG